MARHGRMHHIVPRQRGREEKEEKEEEEQNSPGVATVVSVVFKTMPNTYTGKVKWVTQEPQTLGLIPPMVRSTMESEGQKPTARPHSSSERVTSSRKATETEEMVKPTASPTTIDSTLMVATSSPLVTAPIIAATTIASSAPSATAEASSSGMSGGAKAGLTLGVLCAVGAILAGVLFLYHRKKKQIREKKLDDEKTAMQNMPLPPPPPPQVVEPERAPSISTQRTMSTAPRLSLQPLTQFSPTFNENAKSGGPAVDPSAAPAVPRKGDASFDRPGSSWERLGAANAANATTTNPFNDPQPLSSSPPQNPFGNSAAIETPQPGTPMSANHPRDVDDFANPALAIAAAESLPDSVPAQAQRQPPPSLKETPAPPSPSWTEDLPASPGPAPTGPPPVAAPNNVHRIQLDFKPSMHDELELRTGQLVRMLHEYDDGWALCVRMDRSQQGVVPRTCLSKHPVKPRTGPPRQGPPPPRIRGPPIHSPMGPGGVPHPRPLTPQSGRNSPHPPALSPGNNGGMSTAPRSMSPGPNAMPQTRPRGNSNAPYTGPPRSMSPGPYGGGPQKSAQSPPMGRPRSNSASNVPARRGSPPGPSPMNPNPNSGVNMPMPSRKPLPGQAL